MTQTQQTSWSRDLLQKIVAIKQILIGIFMVFAGLAMIFYSKVNPPTDIWANLAGDIGLSLIPAGTIFLAFDIFGRSEYLDIISQKLLSVLQGEEKWFFAPRLDGIEQRLALGETLHALGVKKIFQDRTTIDFLQYIRAADPKSDIKVMGIALTSFRDVHIQNAIEQKLKEGCKVQFLCLDSESAAVKQRAKAEGRSYEEIKRDIALTTQMHENFIDSRLNPELQKNIELGYYDSEPTHFIFSTNSAMIVGFYLQGKQKRGLHLPHLELEVKEGGMYLPFLEHFELLWAGREKNSARPK
jgi:hypothetical protein